MFRLGVAPPGVVQVRRCHFGGIHVKCCTLGGVQERCCPSWKCSGKVQPSLRCSCKMLHSCRCSGEVLPLWARCWPFWRCSGIHCAPLDVQVRCWPSYRCSGKDVALLQALGKMLLSRVCPSQRQPSWGYSSKTMERVSTRVVVVAVVVVAQPHVCAYACAHASSVTEPKSHRSQPKHLPLHTEESLKKVHPATNFTIQSLAASLVN